jgi:hypothetical protein
VVIIEPGGIRTEWPGIAADKLRKASSGGAYARQADAVLTSITSQANLRRESPPWVIANAIGRAVAAQHPRTRPLVRRHHRRATGVPS